MKDSRNVKHNTRCFILMVALGFVSQIAIAQRIPQPMWQGEFNVHVKNATSFHIYVDAQGTVYGQRCDWYPVTEGYSHRDTVNADLRIFQIDRNGCGTGAFAFNNYKLTINGYSIDVDCRDADYEDGNGDGTGYSTADFWIYFDYNNNCFYKFINDSVQIGSSIAVWEDGRKSPATPRIPVTVQTNFGSGSVVVDNTTETSPYQVKWNANDSSHQVNVASPQSGSYVSFIFSSWSDNGNESHYVTASLGNFGKIWTANFTAKPDAPTNLSFSGNTGDPVKLTWTDNPNQGVGQYYIWRAVNKPDGYTKIDSVSRGVHTWTDPTYVFSSNPDSLLRYRVYSWYSSNGITGLSDPAYVGTTYGIPNNSVARPAEPLAGGARIPKGYSIGSYPNPFNPSATIAYQLPTDATVKMEVYDIAGKKVRMLLDEIKSAGFFSVVWDGRNDQGKDASSGVYMYRFVASPTNGETPFTQSGKLVLMK